MSETVAAYYDQLYPPDLDRRDVYFDSPYVQNVLRGTAADYLAQLYEVPKTPLSRTLWEGIDAFCRGLSKTGVQTNTRKYLVDALLAYADYHHKAVYKLTSEELMSMAQHEAIALTQSVDEMFFSGAAEPTFWLDTRVPARRGTEEYNNQIYALLYPFLYFVFSLILQREELRTILGMNERISGVSPTPVVDGEKLDSVIQTLHENLTLDEIRTILASVPPMISATERVASKHALQCVTQEGLVANVYKVNGGVAARLPALEDCMFRAFEDILARFEPKVAMTQRVVAAFSGARPVEHGYIIGNLAQAEEYVRQGVAGGYNALLSKAATERTHFLGTSLKEGVIARLSEKVALLEQIAEAVESLSTAIEQMVTDTSFAQLAEAAKFLINDGGFVKPLIKRMEGPVSCVFSPSDPVLKDRREKVRRALMLMTGFDHVAEKFSAFSELLKALLSKKPINGQPPLLVREEDETFKMFYELQAFFAQGTETLPNKQVEYLRSVLPKLQEIRLRCKELLDASRGMDVHLSWWLENALGPDSTTSVWYELAQDFNTRSAGGSIKYTKDGKLHGFAPHDCRLSLDGADNKYWELLKERLVHGLWKGNPLWIGEEGGEYVSSVKDHIIDTFPIFREPTTFPVFRDDAILEKPDNVFGVPATGQRPNKKAVYLYEKASRKPVALLTYSLGIVKLVHLSPRNTTYYDSSKMPNVTSKR